MSELLKQSIIDVGRWIDSQGWCPATGGNFSVRCDAKTAWVTASGKHKGELIPSDLLLVDFLGHPINTPLKPSAETLVHTQLYALSEQIGAVLHTHSVASTVLSRLTLGSDFYLHGYEMQKSLTGNTTHDETVRICIFDNTQDMHKLAAALRDEWAQKPLHWGFLVRGHGLYAWGKDMQEAKRHLEGLEFLFACELEMRRLAK
jgi:methylthioribulose-1-phosphate dehydratase